jgi:tetratricopeptide (TPR) repeat protein
VIHREDIDFEISFYEKLLEKNPNFSNALIALGDAYTRSGRYKDGLKIDKRLAELKPDDPVVYYNLACSYSLLKMAEPAFAALEKAMLLGYRDFSFIDKDPDLEFIKKTPRYKKLLASYSKKT